MVNDTLILRNAIITTFLVRNCFNSFRSFRSDWTCFVYFNWQYRTQKRIKADPDIPNKSTPITKPVF